MGTALLPTALRPELSWTQGFEISAWTSAGSCGRWSCVARKRNHDEPLPEGDDWVEWGGQLIWAVGFTSGGAPYGLTVDNFRAGSMELASSADWARAKRAMLQSFGSDAGVRVEVGWVKRMGEGLHRTAFAAEIEITPDVDGASGTYVALLPRRDIDSTFVRRVLQEASLLARLSRLELGLRVPRIAGIISEGGRPLLIETFLSGMPLDLRAGRQVGVRPCQVVGEVAARVHRVDLASLAGLVEGQPTRRDHAHAKLAIFDQLDLTDPLVGDALAWATEHLPPPSPASLVHGDLLGQNILIPVFAESEPRYGLLDWEFACVGDPAYDLAIVTRGKRNHFQIHDGFQRLLEAYEEAGGQPIRATEVSLHEVCLAAHWYAQSLEPSSSVSSGQERARLKGVLARAVARQDTGFTP